VDAPILIPVYLFIYLFICLFLSIYVFIYLFIYFNDSCHKKKGNREHGCIVLARRRLNNKPYNLLIIFFNQLIGLIRRHY